MPVTCQIFRKSKPTQACAFGTDQSINMYMYYINARHVNMINTKVYICILNMIMYMHTKCNTYVLVDLRGQPIKSIHTTL